MCEREREQRSFTLRLDADEEPIAGRLEDERGRGEEFVGWLGLARALEKLLGTPAPSDEDAAGRDAAPPGVRGEPASGL